MHPYQGCIERHPGAGTPTEAFILYKLIVCDLDGTLLTPEHRLGPYTQGVLGRLRGMGLEFSLASGRHFQDIRVLSEQLGGEGCLISSNGAAVHDHTGRLVLSTPLDPECVTFLLTDPAFAQAHTNVYRTDEWLVARPEPFLLQYHQDSGFGYRVADLHAMEPTGVLKVFFYGEPERLQVLESLILECFPERLITTFSLPVTLEVMASGVSKGAALMEVVQRLGIGLDDVIAFGDGMNDRELLALAGKGLIMGNADPRLIDSLPELERIGDNSDESVARYLAGLYLGT